jgi:hypothetical protein
MKSLISVVLVASLMFPAMRAAAEIGEGPTHNLLARTVSPQGFRRGAGQQGPPVNRRWERLRKLDPGTELEVTVHDVKLGTRYFILADESAITTLNPTARTLPRRARGMLRDIASNNPNHFAAGAAFSAVVNKDVRVAPDGVFVADQKIGELEQFVERIDRADIERGTSKVSYDAKLPGEVVAAIWTASLIAGLAALLRGLAAER